MTAKAFGWMILGAVLGSVVGVLVTRALGIDGSNTGAVLGGVLGAHVGRGAARPREPRSNS